jgi:hypothetical protein
MEHFDKLVLDTADFKSAVWLTSVNGVFVVLLHVWIIKIVKISLVTSAVSDLPYISPWKWELTTILGCPGHLMGLKLIH